MEAMELRPYDEKPVRKRGAGFFWWSLFLIVLSGACFASWLGSFYVVGHPEVPKCYRILKKLYWMKSKPQEREAWVRQHPKPWSPEDKAVYNKRFAAALFSENTGAPPKRFEVTKAPKGDFVTPTRLLDKYGKLGPVELERANAELLRNYLMNYREVKNSVPYVVGKYDVVQTYALAPSDMFPSGVAVVAQAIEFPQLLIEMIFTARATMVPQIQAALPVGSDLPLERSRDQFALIHVARRADGRMQFTTVPLPYGGWHHKNGGASFTLMSPADLEEENSKLTLNIDGSLPVVTGARLDKGLEEYAAYRRKTLASVSGDQAALASPELIRFEVSMDAPDAARPRTIRTPAANQAAAPGGNPAATAPLASPTAGRPGSPAPASPPRTLAEQPPAVPLPPRAVRVPPRPGAPVPPAPAPGMATAPPAVVATPVASPVAPPPPPVPMPRRILTTEQASAMVDEFDPNQPTLLAGQFVVTGVLGQRVALRTRDSLRDAKADPTQPGSSAARIVVDYPPGTTPPAKDISITRTGEKPFEIRNVVRGSDGQITIVVTEPKF
jgi:hypothetical protein